MIVEEKFTQPDFIYKILLLGNSGVGKSSFFIRLFEDSFSETHVPTIGIDFKTKDLIKDKDKIRIQIWDTAGQDRFKTITKNYYKGEIKNLILEYKHG